MNYKELLIAERGKERWLNSLGNAKQKFVGEKNHEMKTLIIIYKLMKLKQLNN